MPLPQYGDYKTFQTKSLDNTMTHYIINEHGELLKEQCEYGWAEGDPNAESLADRLPQTRLISSEIVPTKHNGEVIFYDYWKGENGEDLDGWIEYCGIFLNGLLQGEIQIVKKEEPRNFTPEEIERNKKWKEEAAERRAQLKQERMEKIKATQALVKALSDAQDAIYQKLTDELYLSKSDEEWLFDAVFNDTAHSWEKVEEIV
jgi:hypothetical protein